VLKCCTLFRRPAGKSVEEYQAYWRTGHVPFIKAMAPVRKYVQNHPFAINGREPAYDGLVELWVDDIEKLKAMGKSPEYAAVVEDEKNFVDRSTIELTLADEHVVLDGQATPDAVKQVILLKRKPGMTPAEFQDYWLNRHAPLVGRPPGLIRYVQSHARLSGYRDGREPPWDGIGTMTFASLEAMQQARTAPGQDVVKADAANFADTSRLVSFLTREHVMIAGR
jgi:uncharacterized protein (TIGR02118 family)